MKRKILISAIGLVIAWTLITTSAFATSHWKNTSNKTGNHRTELSMSWTTSKWFGKSYWKNNHRSKIKNGTWSELSSKKWITQFLRADLTTSEKLDVKMLMTNHKLNISKIEKSTWALQDKKTAIGIEHSTFVSAISKYIDKTKIVSFDTFINDMATKSSKKMKWKHKKQLLDKDI